jgi:hypothetical protein
MDGLMDFHGFTVLGGFTLAGMFDQSQNRLFDFCWERIPVVNNSL